MNHAAKTILSTGATVAVNQPCSVTVIEKPDSLFEGFAWIYIFCREKVFRDDTNRIIRAFWPAGEPPSSSKVLELGCGPGLYARALAQRFQQISVLGVDNSRELVKYARAKAIEKALHNCAFAWGDVLNLPQPDNAFSQLVASRLFTILSERERAVGEIFRVLNSGGKCFVAEPRFAFSESIPLLTMRALARINGYSREYREPVKATVLPYSHFCALFASQPWSRMKTWRVGRYQYALCEKG
jgi:ubiquinone/menaquinone biosynthesis C-methylase UbiE